MALTVEVARFKGAVMSGMIDPKKSSKPTFLELLENTRHYARREAKKLRQELKKKKD